MSIKQSVEITDGAVRLPAQLIRPQAPGAHPAVVVAPGGIERGLIAAYDWVASRLADAGFATLTITYRESQATHDPDDVSIGLDWLLRQPDVASGRCGIFGHSRGGLAALRAAAQDSRIRSVVSLAAPTDFSRYVRSVEAYAPSRHRQIVDWIGGTPDELPERYAVLRGLAYADRIRQPVLLIQGSADMNIPMEHALWMEQALRNSGNQGVQVELIERMGHFCEVAWQGYQFDRVAGLAVSWFSRTLQDAS